MRNRNICLPPTSPILSRDLQQPVRVDLESANQFGLTSRLRSDTGQFEFSQEIVLLASNSLAFVDGEGDLSLVVLDEQEVV